MSTDRQKRTSSNDWVTLASFAWYPEALMLKCRLDAEGIESNLPEGQIGSTYPAATGLNVRVQVRASRLTEARELLEVLEQDHKDNPPPEEGPESCSRCGGHLYRRPVGALARWLSALLGFAVLVPMRSTRDKWVCENCGKRF